jgi:hypothetical protein
MTLIIKPPDWEEKYLFITKLKQKKALTATPNGLR